jgi:hypothetical protein
MRINELAEMFGPKDREQKVLLSDWYEEYEFDLATRAFIDADNDQTGEIPSLDSPRLKDAIKPFDQTIETGQIRILSGRYISNPGQIPFIAVVSKWSGDSWLIIPFSRFCAPATQGEMETNSTFAFQKTLQVWNARTVHTLFLEKSWVFDRLGESVCQQAKDLFLNLTAGDALPQTFTARRGCSITNSMDLRRLYLEDEIEQFFPLSQLINSWEASRLRLQQSVFKLQYIKSTSISEEPFSMAAADKEINTVKNYAISGVGVRLNIECSKAENRVLINVFDEQGNFSNICDGWTILNGDGTILSAVGNSGFVEFKFNVFSGTFSIVDHDGRIRELTET